MQTLPHLLVVCLIVSACGAHVDTPSLQNRSGAAKIEAIAVSKPRPPLGRPDGPYPPGATVVWDNGDGTFGAIMVHPRTDN